MFYVGFYVIAHARGVRPGRSRHIPETTAPCRQFTGHLFDLAPKLFASAGVLLIVGLFYGGIVLLQYSLGGRSLPQGLTMVVLLITFLGGTIMLALVLGPYIFRIFGEGSRDPAMIDDDGESGKVRTWTFVRPISSSTREWRRSNEREPRLPPRKQGEVRARLQDLRAEFGRLLDIGCGTGFIIDLAADQFDDVRASI